MSIARNKPVDGRRRGSSLRMTPSGLTLAEPRPFPSLETHDDADSPSLPLPNWTSLRATESRRRPLRFGLEKPGRRAAAGERPLLDYPRNATGKNTVDDGLRRLVDQRHAACITKKVTGTLTATSRSFEVSSGNS